MQRTFVPDEALTPTHSILLDLDSRHSERSTSGAESLGTSQTRYNLFRNGHEPELYCAVPEDRPAPAFLQSDRWQVAGQMDESGATPLGFDWEAAKIGIRLNGFYLFVAFRPVRKLRSDGLLAALENRKNAT
ncbi:hypothetical protein [Microvirga arabica]|uniref:hypothetical protein n=1 Tax=Microvirga arabica TaxID=1128671 RepID=UPI001FE58A02|nr:hypothetical protein [Microvirga arabica]